MGGTGAEASALFMILLVKKLNISLRVPIDIETIAPIVRRFFCTVFNDNFFAFFIFHPTYFGVLHEYADSALATVRDQLNGDFYVESRRLGARNLDPQKYLKDAQVLAKGLEQEPTNSRYMFYLGQSYHNAGLLDKAIEAYDQRINAGGWAEAAPDQSQQPDGTRVCQLPAARGSRCASEAG